MAVSIAALAIGAGIAIYGAVEKNKAAKAAQANTMPQYQIPQSEYDNQRIAESQAGQGMSAASKQAYMNNADEGLAATTSAILRGGGDANTLGSAYDRYNTGIQNLSIYDDQARQSHLNNLVAQNTRMAALTDKSYQMNQYAPWANRAQLYASQIAGANQTIGQGIGIAGKGVTGLAGAIGQGGGSDTPDANTGGNSSFTQQQSIQAYGQPAVMGQYNNSDTYNYGANSNYANQGGGPGGGGGGGNGNYGGNGSGWGWSGFVPQYQ